jgi:hypothetical protein
MESKPFVWTDDAQANDRLSNTVMLFDGRPVYIDRASGGLISIRNTDGSSWGPVNGVPFDDPRWNNFRGIPKLGWTNLVMTGRPEAVFLERIPVRNRRHGLCQDNTLMYTFDGVDINPSRTYSLFDILANKGYLATLAGDYPSLPEIMERLPTGCCVAFSSSYAVLRDDGGVSWLYRNTTRIGFLSDSTVSCFQPKMYLTDEILETVGPNFHVRSC